QSAGNVVLVEVVVVVVPPHGFGLQVPDPTSMPPACRQAFGVFTTHPWPCPEGRQHWVRGGSLAGLLPPLDSTKDIMAISATRYGLTTSVMPAPRLSGTFTLAWGSLRPSTKVIRALSCRPAQWSTRTKVNEITSQPQRAPQKWGGT